MIIVRFTIQDRVLRSYPQIVCAINGHGCDVESRVDQRGVADTRVLVFKDISIVIAIALNLNDRPASQHLIETLVQESNCCTCRYIFYMPTEAMN